MSKQENLVSMREVSRQLAIPTSGAQRLIQLRLIKPVPGYGLGRDRFLREDVEKLRHEAMLAISKNLSTRLCRWNNETESLGNDLNSALAAMTPEQRASSTGQALSELEGFLSSFSVENGHLFNFCL